MPPVENRYLEYLNKLSKNLFTFVSGIAFGLSIGVGITFYYLDNKINQTIDKNSQVKNQIGLLQKFMDFASNSFSQQPRDTVQIVKIIKQQSQTEEATYQQPDTLSQQASDTSFVASPTFTDDEGVVIKKDELITSRYVDIVEVVKFSAATDTLSGAFTRTPRNVVGRLWVEFWKSPLNYRGYKYNNNKLVIYGLSEDESVRIVKRNEDLYFKHNTAFYRIANMENFSSLQRVTDDLVLLDLNQF